jgi:hypothetical protein
VGISRENEETGLVVAESLIYGKVENKPGDWSSET